jgi:hypothetical protein
MEKLAADWLVNTTDTCQRRLSLQQIRNVSEVDDDDDLGSLLSFYKERVSVTFVKKEIKNHLVHLRDSN